MNQTDTQHELDVFEAAAERYHTGSGPGRSWPSRAWPRPPS